MTISAPLRTERPDQIARVGTTKKRPAAATDGVPPLERGDHLSRVEFERRYAAMPYVKKAELIEGVVYMPSPVYVQHGEPHANVMGWLFVYKMSTPGVRSADNTSVRLDFDNEVQPDAVLFRDPKHGGRCSISSAGFLENSPELIVEVAVSSVSFDMNTKLRVYRRNGVPEYLALLAQEERAVWHVLTEGEYRVMEPDEQGILRSQVFPGLWLHPEHFWTGDLPKLMAVLDQGLASQEHTDFAAELARST
jgi:Uma2 family endonuclease